MKNLKALSCLASLLAYAVVCAQTPNVTVAPNGTDMTIYTEVNVGSNWEFILSTAYAAGSFYGPSGSSSVSSSLPWMLVVDWYGSSVNEPSATGSAVSELSNGASATAESTHNCSCNSSGTADIVSQPATATGQNSDGPNTQWDSGTPYTTQGSSLVFWYISSSHWQALPTFHTTSLAAAASATGLPNSRGASAAGQGMVQTMGNWGFISSTLVVTANN